MNSPAKFVFEKCLFAGAGLAPDLAEPQDLMINFGGNKEAKPYPARPGRGRAGPYKGKFCGDNFFYKF